MSATISIAIHGGAGTIEKHLMTAEKEVEYLAALNASVRAGYEQLRTGKAAIDAVEAAIKVLEDCPLFNAGKGAVFTNDGHNELDASIMDGRDLGAGAVAAVKTVRYPIEAARAVMEKSQHVMMVGDGADRFARENGLETVDPSFFFVQHRWDQLEELRGSDSVALDHSSSENKTKFGTVGCVALDQFGNLAAGTSTGGMTNKKVVLETHSSKLISFDSSEESGIRQSSVPGRTPITKLAQFLAQATASTSCGTLSRTACRR